MKKSSSKLVYICIKHTTDDEDMKRQSQSSSVTVRPWSAFSNNSENEKPAKVRNRPKTTENHKEAALTDNTRDLASKNSSRNKKRVSSKSPSARPASSRPGPRTNSSLNSANSKTSKPGSALNERNPTGYLGTPSFGAPTYPRPVSDINNKDSKKNLTGKSSRKEKWAVTQLDRDSSDEDSDVELKTYIEPLSEGDEAEEILGLGEDDPQDDLAPQQTARISLPDSPEALMQWLAGPGYNSDDYDTDLEEDFPPEPEPPVDATGKYTYKEQCEKRGSIPVSYLLRNLGEGNLRMRHHYLGGHGTVPLAEALKKNTVCEEIDLSDNYIEGEGASSLAEMLKDNMFVVNLNISNNFIRSQGAAAFAEMLETNTTLKTLSLKGNNLCDSDAKRIAEALAANMSLGCLDLSHNDFGELGGMFIGVGMASNIGLSDLDVSWNGIRQKGAVALCKALQKNASLEILDISWNGMGLPGGTALGTSLKTNKTLKVLDISHNGLNAEAAKKIALGLAKNEGLETLLMGMNPIGEAGMEAILKAVSTNTSLKLVGMEGCHDISISPGTHKKIQDIQEGRDILIMFTNGSPQQSRINQTILCVFDRFISDNSDRMEDLFNQMDKDKSGNITLEEFKYGLKDFGLRLTSKQMDMLLDELDADRSGTIEFDEWDTIKLRRKYRSSMFKSHYNTSTADYRILEGDLDEDDD